LYLRIINKTVFTGEVTHFHFLAATVLHRRNQSRWSKFSL